MLVFVSCCTTMNLCSAVYYIHCTPFANTQTHTHEQPVHLRTPSIQDVPKLLAINVCTCSLLADKYCLAAVLYVHVLILLLLMLNHRRRLLLCRIHMYMRGKRAARRHMNIYIPTPKTLTAVASTRHHRKASATESTISCHFGAIVPHCEKRTQRVLCVCITCA